MPAASARSASRPSAASANPVCPQRGGLDQVGQHKIAEVRGIVHIDAQRGLQRRLEAGAVEQKAARLLARCEGAATPPVQTITARVRLTPAELDIAQQAAAGRSNQQIADDMHLSVRTVGNHLQRAYEKLGVSGRQELAGALQEQSGAQPPNS